MTSNLTPAVCPTPAAIALSLYNLVMGELSPIESEFDRTEDAEAYDRSFRRTRASRKFGPALPKTS